MAMRIPEGGARNVQPVRSTPSTPAAATPRVASNVPRTVRVPAPTPPPPPTVDSSTPGFIDSYIADMPEAAQAAPPRPEINEKFIVDNDGEFKAQEAALKAALAAYTSDIEAQKQRYNVDYGNSLRKLGFTGDLGSVDKARWDSTDGRLEVDNNPIEGLQWNETDQTVASGRGLTGTLNDFAARGMLQSSAYANARNDLFRSLNEQLGSTSLARANTFDEMNRQVADRGRESEAERAAAVRAAISRQQALLG